MARNVMPQTESVRTTLDLPVDLLERSNRIVGAGKVKSRNTLIVAALQGYLDELERAEVDAAFAAMEHDVAYQRLNLQLAGDFALSDQEALEAVEG